MGELLEHGLAGDFPRKGVRNLIIEFDPLVVFNFDFVFFLAPAELFELGASSGLSFCVSILDLISTFDFALQLSLKLKIGKTLIGSLSTSTTTFDTAACDDCTAAAVFLTAFY